MRAIVACVLALALAPVVADAHRPVPRLPPTARRCQSAATYGALETCLKQLGDVSIVRDLTHARLLRISAAGNDLGLSLYVQDGQGWHLGGIFEGRGRSYDVLAVAPLTIDRHTGFRIDIGESQHTWVSLDSVRAVPAVVVSHQALLCDGSRWRCTEVVVACDTLVRGAAVWTFHGAVSFADNQVHITGDRSRSGLSCNVPQDMFLGWPQP